MQPADESLFRLLVERVRDYAIFLISPHGIVQSWNEGAQRLKGYAAHEIVGQHCSRFYTEEDRANSRFEYLLGLAEDNGRVEDEGWRVRKDGSRFWADVIITALRDDSGMLRGFAKVTRDLTERRHVEEQRSLRLAAERAAERVGRLQTVTAALATTNRPEEVAELLTTAGLAAVGASAGAVAFPSDGDDVLQVVHVTGYGPTSVLLHQRIQRDDPYTLAEVWRTNQPVFITSREHVADLYPRLAQLSTSSRYEAWAAIPLAIQRRVLGIFTMSFDEPHAFDEEERGFVLAMGEVAAQAIDRARLFDSERRTRAEAEAAVRAQDEFLSIASHELRTPVAAVKATAQLAQRSIERGTFDPQRIQRHLDGIARAADRLSSLVEDLLDVSRLRTGQLRLRRQTVDIAPVLKDVLERYAAHSESLPELTFTLSLPDHPIVVDVDTSRLEQVLDNFLSNAVKYSPSGGEIRLEAEADAAGTKVTVTDHGIGLPPGQEQRIFEPFGRAPNAAAQHIPGLGLGLAICRQLLEAHGGNVWASSGGEHQGTTVGLWLPAAHPSAEALSSPT